MVPKCTRAEGGRSRGRLGIRLMQVRSPEKTPGSGIIPCWGLSVNVGVVEKRGSIFWIGKLWGNGASHALGAHSASLLAEGSAGCAPLALWTADSTLRRWFNSLRKNTQGDARKIFSPRGMVGWMVDGGRRMVAFRRRAEKGREFGAVSGKTADVQREQVVRSASWSLFATSVGVGKQAVVCRRWVQVRQATVHELPLAASKRGSSDTSNERLMTFHVSGSWKRPVHCRITLSVPGVASWSRCWLFVRDAQRWRAA